MNKSQIISPLIAIGLFAVICALIVARNERQGFLQRRAAAVGHDLIMTTNSLNLVLIGPHLQERLNQFLANTGRVARIALGDEPPPIGNGEAAVRIFFDNQKAERLALRLRPDSDSAQLHVLGFWSP